MIFNKNIFESTAIALVMVCVTVFGLTACASQPAGGQSISAAAVQQTLGALQVELNQTATAEKNGLIQMGTSIAQTQTAAVTPLPTRTITPTADVQKTQQVADVFLKIQQYAKDNYLPSTSGAYQRLNDQTLYYAKPNYYKWTDIGLMLDDFAFESDVSWENTSVPAKDVMSGCGFVFHSDGDTNYRMAYLGLDGSAYIYSVSNDNQIMLGQAPFGKVDPLKGSAHIALVVSGNQYTLFVNGKMLLQEKSAFGTPKTGQFAYTVYSGSDKGVGTTCKFSNIDLWVVKPAN